MASWSSSKTQRPRWARKEVLDERDEAKRAPYRAMTPQQRARVLVDVCRLAIDLVNTHPDPRASLRRQTPIPERSRLLWQRLRREYRRDGHEL